MRLDKLIAKRAKDGWILSGLFYNWRYIDPATQKEKTHRYRSMHAKKKDQWFPGKLYRVTIWRRKSGGK